MDPPHAPIGQVGSRGEAGGPCSAEWRLETVIPVGEGRCDLGKGLEVPLVHSPRQLPRSIE